MSISLFDERISDFLGKYKIKHVTLDDVERCVKFHIESSMKSNNLWHLIKDDYETLY